MNIDQHLVSRGPSPARRGLQNIKFVPRSIRYWFLAAILLAAFSSRGGALFWDAGNTNNGPVIDPGSGGWDTDITTNLNWNNGASNVSWVDVASTTASTNQAIFNGPDAPDGTYSVVLDGPQIAISNLTINASGYAFSGSALYVVNNAGNLPVISVVDGKTVFFTNNIVGPNSANVWQLGGNGAPATMVVLGNIGGNGGLQTVFNSTNGSTFYFGGNTACAVTTIDANVMQTNGTSTGANTWQVGRSVAGSGGNLTGVFTLDGPATIQNFTTSLQISRGGGNGTVIVQNGATMNIGVSSAQNIQIESELSNNSHGAFIVTGGTVNIGTAGSPTAMGQILFNRQGSNPGSTAAYAQSGGVVNAWGGIVFGQPTGNFINGMASLTNSGGSLYVGPTGIMKNTGSAPTNIIDLTGGLVGCMANWLSSMPMILDNANGNITFQCSDINGTPYNISLTGSLTGPGGFNKIGAGTLTLSGTNNYLGSTVISNGTLVVKAANLPTNGPVTMDGSAGNPLVSVQIGNQSQDWNMGTLTFAAGTPTMDFNFSTVTPSGTLAPVQVNGDLAFTVTPVIQVEGSNILSGTYPLIKYTGNLSGVPPTALVSLPVGATTATLVNNAANKSIDLQVSSTLVASLQWAVGDGSWDLSSLNWVNVGSQTPVAYADPKPVQFNDNASGTSPINVAIPATVSPSSVSFNGVTKSYILSGAGTISGAGGLTVSGGSATLANTNSYGGGTTVTFPGQLNINAGGDATHTAIGSGALNINAANATSGAKIDNTSGQPVSILATINENWNDDWTFVGSGNLATGPGGISLNNNSVGLTVVSNTLEVDGIITDNGQNNSLVKLGNGTLTLKSDNTFAGGFELGAGKVNFGSTLNAGAGILKIDGSSSFDNVSGAPLTLTGFPSVTIQAAVGEAITFLGSNDLDFGSVAINANNGQQETWNVVSNKLIFEGDINSGNTTITKIGQGTLVLAGIAVNNQFTGIINEGEIDLAKDAGPAIGTGGQGFLVQSNAIAKITGGGGNQIPDSVGGASYIQTRLNAGGVLDMNGGTETLDMLAMTNGVLRNGAASSFSTLNLPGDGGTHPTNAVTLYGNNNIFDVPAVDAELDINGIVNGAASYTKTGLGTLSLLTSNNYTGNVTVSAGTLILAFPDLTNTTTVTLGTSTMLNLNFANGETNTIAALIINGVSKAPGMYNSTTDPTYLAGSGSLLVVPVATVNPIPGILQLSNAGGGNLQLAWPTNAGWILQSNSVGLTATNSWFPIPNSANITNLNVTIDHSGSNVYFRLLHP